MFYEHELAVFRAVVSYLNNDPLLAKEDAMRLLKEATDRLDAARQRDVLGRAGLAGLRTGEIVAAEVAVVLRCENGWAWN